MQVLNKSAIVLLSAFWEAFCEDLAAEALQEIVDEASDASALPKDLKKTIAKELKENPDQNTVWQLADDGWKVVLSNRMASLKASRDRRLNAPNSGNIDKLFSDSLGISSLSNSWYWKNMTVVAARQNLDLYLQLRHEIAPPRCCFKPISLEERRKRLLQPLNAAS